MPGGMALLERDDLVRESGRLPVALEAFPGDIALGGEALCLAGFLQQRSPLGERALHLGAMPASNHQGVPVALQPGEPGFAVRDGRLGARDGHLRDAEPSGVLLTLRVELAERPVEATLDRARAAVGAADGCLEPVPQRSSSRARSSTSWWRTDAVERKNFSEGMPVSSASSSSARAGSVMV